MKAKQLWLFAACFVTAILRGTAFVKNEEVFASLVTMVDGDAVNEADGSVAPPRFALNCTMVGGKTGNVTVLSNYENGGILKTINVIAGATSIKVVNVSLTTGDTVLFGNLSAALTNATVNTTANASFAFQPGETITELTLWTNNVNQTVNHTDNKTDIPLALGAISYTTSAGRQFDIGLTNGTRGDPTKITGDALGSGLVTAVKAISDSDITALGFEFLRPLTEASVTVSRYPKLPGTVPSGTQNVLGDAVYENPTSSDQSVGFSGSPTLKIEHNWTTTLGGDFGVEVDSVSAAAPLLRRSTSEDINWVLDEPKTWPLTNILVKQPSYNFSVMVPGGAKVFSKVVVTTYELQLQYDGHAILQTNNHASWSFPVSGSYSGEAAELGESTVAVT